MARLGIFAMTLNFSPSFPSSHGPTVTVKCFFGMTCLGIWQGFGPTFFFETTFSGVFPLRVIDSGR